MYLSELQFFLDICPGVGLLGHIVAPFLIKVSTFLGGRNVAAHIRLHYSVNTSFMCTGKF